RIGGFRCFLRHLGSSMSSRWTRREVSSSLDAIGALQIALPHCRQNRSVTSFSARQLEQTVTRAIAGGAAPPAPEPAGKTLGVDPTTIEFGGGARFFVMASMVDPNCAMFCWCTWDASRIRATTRSAF